MKCFLSLILLILTINASEIFMIGKKGAILPFRVFKKVNGVEIRNGGYGSSIYGDINHKNRFYGLTDKGVVYFVPEIGHFEIGKNGKITLLNVVKLKGKINPEGLVVLEDGTFWISDEFGPDIVHFDKNGNGIEKIGFLPKEFKNRRQNHGFEGLAITPDKQTLVALMQSSLQNPNKKTKRSKLTRILTINLKTKKVAQYIYKQERKRNSNSEIRAINEDEFLIIERDSKNPLKSKSFKRVYKISLKSGTNIENLPKNAHLKQDKNLGLLIDGKTLEQIVSKKGWKYLRKRGVYPVKKTLVVDLIKELNYPYDKPEGLWIVDKNTIAILNDDDFGVKIKNGKLKQKYLKKPTIDTGTLHVIKGVKF